MSITSMSNRARMAEKLSIEQLQQSIQDGVLPSYIGVPLLKSKVEDAKLLQAAKAAQSMSQQPSVAQQIMSQAQQVEQPAPQMADQGVPALQSNLPASMAGGGIVAFAEGGMYDEDDTDEDRQDAERQAEMDGLMEEYAQTFQQGIGQLPAAQPQSREAPAQSQGSDGMAGGDNSDFLARIMQKESGGRRYGKDGKLLTSSKGAEGEMQVMPATSRDPGFGVKPARDDSPDEKARVARDYANTLLERYGDPKLAAIAYNMGPGATDKWLMAGADMSKLPKETQGYVKGFAGGGEVQRFADGGLMDQIDLVGSQVDEARKEFEKIPRPGQRQMQSDPSALEKYQAAKARKEALELGYQNIMGSAGIDKAAFGNYRGALGTKKPEANPLVQAMGAQQPEIVKKEQSKVDKNLPTAPAKDPSAIEADQGLLSGIDIGGPGSSPANMGAPVSLASPTDVATPAKPDRYAKYEEMFAKREENLGKQREQDKYMAMLQAGLGMMGGTSRNALANIGAGGQQGIQALAQSNAARTAEENALLSGRLGLEKIGANREYQDSMMAYRKDLADREDTRKRDLAGATMDEKKENRGLREQEYGMKRLTDINKNAEIQAEKAIAANPAVNFAADRESKKQAMIADILRRNSAYAKTYQSIYGADADPFEGLGQAGGGGTRIKFDTKGNMI